MAPEHFHVTAIKLEHGSIIHPGNWGRIMRRYQRITTSGQMFGDAWLLARELIFEMIRRERFPDKPSRWDSAFCCPNLECAQEYQAANDPSRLNLIYRVALLDDAPQHIGSLGAFAWLPQGAAFVESYEEIAKAYWTGHSSGPQEIVTTSRLKVLEAVH